MPDSKSRARKIKLLLFDVDGVVTDGKLFFVPTAAGRNDERAGKPGAKGGINLSSQGSIEIKGFHDHDGTAISLARVGGITTEWVIQRSSVPPAGLARRFTLGHI